MLSDKRVSELARQGRTISVAETGDDDLGPLKLLPGVWKNTNALNGHGWNLIALPFAGGASHYRLLMNQYNEELHFSIVDKGVPNRGIARGASGATETDQRVVTLDYDQAITQIAAADNPVSGDAGGGDLPIHREPGLWLHMTNFNTDGLDIARLGSVPHGDSVLALGKAAIADGAPDIAKFDGLPLGVTRELG
ncbi:MAG: hypothetical protein LJE68_14560, partial [Rhodobacter sp.]|nr:hypothetical protein [Rhodobacter sp.]